MIHTIYRKRETLLLSNRLGLSSLEAVTQEKRKDTRRRDWNSRLEPREGKLSRVVLRGERVGNNPDLLDNIQVWVEHEYDTRLLHRNLAFPLLRKLVEAGDSYAKRVFKEEIAMRLSSGYPSVVRYLLNEGYLTYLSVDEIESLPNFKPTLTFYLDLAEDYISKRKFNQADKISRLILKKNPNNLKELNELASLFGRIHNYHKAVETMRKELPRGDCSWAGYDHVRDNLQKAAITLSKVAQSSQ